MEHNIRNMNTTALAFMGDAVYEVYIRKLVMSDGQTRADRLHAMAVPYVRAKGQATAVKKMMNEGFLTEEELALVKRARNHKISSKPKNAGPVEYKLATAFEALLGALYLCGEIQRLEEIVKEAEAIIRNMQKETNHTGEKR